MERSSRPAAAPSLAAAPPASDPRLLGGVVDAVWSTLCSVRMAIVMILLIAAGAFVGAALAQAPAPARADPAQFSLWLDAVRLKYGMWTDIFARLQLFNVFTSLWFRLLIVLLSANIIVCAFSRAPGLWRVSRRGAKARIGPAMFERAPLAEGVAAGDIEAERAAARVATVLRRRRFGVRVEHEGDTVHIVGEKNRYARLATLVHHGGLIVVLLGAIWGGRGGFREPQVIVAEGDEVAVGHDTGVSIRLESFVAEFYPGGGGMPKDYRSEIVLLRDGEEVASGTVRVNSPLIYRGLRFHQSFYGPAIMMRVVSEAGEMLFERAVALSWSTQGRSAGSFVVPGAALQVFIVAPASAFYDPVIRPGQVRLEIYPLDDTTPLALGNVSQGVPATIGGLSYSFLRETRYTGLQVVKDPGLPLVWFGSAVVVLGAAVVLLFPHRRIWARVERDERGRTEVRLAAAKERGMPFEYEFKRITDAVGGQFPASPGGTSPGGRGRRS